MKISLYAYSSAIPPETPEERQAVLNKEYEQSMRRVIERRLREARLGIYAWYQCFCGYSVSCVANYPINLSCPNCSKQLVRLIGNESVDGILVLI